MRSKITSHSTRAHNSLRVSCACVCVEVNKIFVQRKAERYLPEKEERVEEVKEEGREGEGGEEKHSQPPHSPQWHQKTSRGDTSALGNYE